MLESVRDDIMYLTNNICWFCGTSLEDGFGHLSLFGALCDKCKAAMEKEESQYNVQ